MNIIYADFATHGRMYWSNDIGWVFDTESATKFTDEEKLNLNLPTEAGGWVPHMTNLFGFDVYLGVDGVPVVHVNTDHIEENSEGPICRVYINDEPIFENPSPVDFD